LKLLFVFGSAAGRQDGDLIPQRSKGSNELVGTNPDQAWGVRNYE